MRSKWRVCSTPGCGDLTPRGGRCGGCRRLYEKSRGTAAQRGYDAEWRRTRGRKLAEVPFCEYPGCDSTAVDVHHQIGGPLDPTGHDLEWLTSYCHRHHSMVTGEAHGWRHRAPR
jgi:5-methylcytosine-specific restriction protein A